jgi:sugar phosphate isomerase/epimerase
MATAIATGPFGIATGSYVTERDDWPLAIGRARMEGWRTIELTAIDAARLEGLVALLAGEPGALNGFERVSVHAPVRFARGPSEVRTILAGLPFELILHPDVYGNEPWVEVLRSRAVFENMDVAKSYGRKVAELDEVLGRFPEAGFCLDVAHVWTNDPTLRLGHELLDAFGARLRQLHVSGIEPDGAHRSTTRVDLELYEPLLTRCVHVPWLLEGELAEDAR